MACEPYGRGRRKRTTLGSYKIDEGLLIAVQAEAIQRQCSIEEYITSALVNALDVGLLPASGHLRICETHNVVMEQNSSGTTWACPVEEGDSSAIVIPFVP